MIRNINYGLYHAARMSDAFWRGYSNEPEPPKRRRWLDVVGMLVLVAAGSYAWQSLPAKPRPWAPDIALPSQNIVVYGNTFANDGDLSSSLLTLGTASPTVTSVQGVADMSPLHVCEEQADALAARLNAGPGQSFDFHIAVGADTCTITGVTRDGRGITTTVPAVSPYRNMHVQGDGVGYWSTGVGSWESTDVVTRPANAETVVPLYSWDGTSWVQTTVQSDTLVEPAETTVTGKREYRPNLGQKR